MANISSIRGRLIDNNMQNMYQTDTALLLDVEKDPDNSTCFNFDNSTPAVASQLLMSFVIIMLNFMVVAIICTSPKKVYRKPAFIFIVALAFTDMMLALCLISFSAVSIGKFQFSARKWVLLTASTSVCFNASVNFLLVIALDRLCFIGYNRRYHEVMTNRKIFILILLCWGVGLLPVLPLFFNNVGSCAPLCECFINQPMICSDVSCSTVLNGFTKSFLFGLFFYFLIMLLSISSVYTMLFWKVHLHSNRVHSHSNEASMRLRPSRMRREFKLARTLGIVVITFFACWSPLILLYVIDFATSNTFVFEKSLALAISSPAILNSMLNPIIYAARIPLIRKRVTSCFCKADDSFSESSATRRKAARESWKKGGPSRKKGSKPSTSSCKEIRQTRESRSSMSSSHFSSTTDNLQTTVPSNDERFTLQIGRIVNVVIRHITSTFRLAPDVQPQESAPANPAIVKYDNVFKEGDKFTPLNDDVSVTMPHRDSVFDAEE